MRPNASFSNIEKTLEIVLLAFLITIQNNEKLNNKLQSMLLPTRNFISIPTADGASLNAMLIYPPNFDPSQKYAALINVYGGPNSQNVLNSFWKGGFNFYVASQLGYIVVSVDGR